MTVINTEGYPHFNICEHLCICESPIGVWNVALWEGRTHRRLKPLSFSFASPRKPLADQSESSSPIPSSFRCCERIGNPKGSVKRRHSKAVPQLVRTLSWLIHHLLSPELWSCFLSQLLSWGSLHNQNTPICSLGGLYRTHDINVYLSSRRSVGLDWTNTIDATKVKSVKVTSIFCSSSLAFSSRLEALLLVPMILESRGAEETKLHLTAKRHPLYPLDSLAWRVRLFRCGLIGGCKEPHVCQTCAETDTMCRPALECVTHYHTARLVFTQVMKSYPPSSILWESMLSTAAAPASLSRTGGVQCVHFEEFWC